MPLTNHLQPTSFHVHPTGHPDSKLKGFHLFDRRTVFALRSGWAACLSRDPVTATLVSHCWRHQPWMVRGLVSHRPTPANSPPLSGYSVSRVIPPPSLSLVREPSESTGQHLLSPSIAGVGIPPPILEGQDPLPCAQPRTPFHEPEILSTNESHLLTRTFVRGLPWAATSSWTSPSSPWLPTCFHASSQEALDPPAFRYSLGPFGPPVARQSLQQSAPRALHRLPRFSMGLRRTAFPPNDILLSKDADRAYSGQGSLSSLSTSTPVSATARLDGFTPT